MASGKIKRAPPYYVVAHWASSAWTSIPAELVAKSFKKCHISNTLDGVEDDILLDDDEADSIVDDPSSNYLPLDRDDAGEDDST